MGNIEKINTLVINAHPEYEFKGSYTSVIQDMYITKLEKLKEENKNLGEIEVLNLYDEKNIIPAIDKKVLKMYRNKWSADGMDDEDAKINERIQEIVHHFKEFKRIVIVTPIYNYNIMTRLKDYMDNILVARETFKQEKGGKLIGLLNDGRHVTVMQASGSVYEKDNIYTKIDVTNHYLKSMFVDVMGFESFNVVRAEGTSRKNVTREEILNKVEEDLEKLFNKIY